MMKAEAYVNVKLRIKADSIWGDDCQISQIKKQAQDGAERLLRTYLENVGDIEILNYDDVKIVLMEDGE